MFFEKVWLQLREASFWLVCQKSLTVTELEADKLSKCVSNVSLSLERHFHTDIVVCGVWAVGDTGADDDKSWIHDETWTLQ